MDAPRKIYRPWNPDFYRQQSHSPDSKLPEGDLVFFFLDVIDQLDLGAIYAPYEDQLRGAPPFDPRMMTCLWLYAYSVLRRSAVPDDKAQTSFTDPELKIMPQSNKRFAYSGNAQVVVDDACQIISAADVTMESNDKQQAVPMAKQALANLEEAGIARRVNAQGEVDKVAGVLDSGYCSEKAVAGLETLGFAPHIATERPKHHAPLNAPAPESLPAKATAKDKMKAKLQTAPGRALYGLRKGIVEPVFGQIKAARGFRRFSMRGLKKVKAEWRLVCLTHNLLKLWRYHHVPSMN